MSLFNTDLKILWDIECSKTMIGFDNTATYISLGGNHAYYKNVLRNILKKNWKLKDIYEKYQPKL